MSDTDFGEAEALSDEVEEALRRQDEALALLERLRSEEPFLTPKGDSIGGGRRDFRRWPTPPGVTVEMHDGLRWHLLQCGDMGVGGARASEMPAWVQGPVPGRLKAPGMAGAVLVLTDVMWQDAREHKAGVRFEFQDAEEREQWSDALIDALLARHALG